MPGDENDETSSHKLMMEETDTRENHRHIVFIRGLNDYVITSGATWFQNIFHAADSCAVNTVTEGEESIRAEGGLNQASLESHCCFSSRVSCRGV